MAPRSLTVTSKRVINKNQSRIVRIGNEERVTLLAISPFSSMRIEKKTKERRKEMQPKVCYSSDTISKYAVHDCKQHGKERGGIKNTG